MPDGRLTVFLADDNLLVREGVRALLSLADDIEVVGVADDYDSLIREAERLEPNVLVTDIRMPPNFRREGIEAAQEVRKRHPGTGVVVLSQYDDPEYAVSLLSEGSAGYAYLLKDHVAEGDQLIHAIRTVSTGGSWLDPRIVDALVTPMTNTSGLSDAEELLLRQVAEGRPIKAIAAAEKITPAAAADAVEKLFLKLAQQASAGTAGALQSLKTLHRAIVDREEQGETLSRLLPGGIAERLRGGSHRIGETERLTVTVLMSDIRGYSTIAEAADPSVLALQLSEHRGEMSRAIIEEGGTVMQFVGDAVMGVFGAPLPLQEHAEHAVRGARTMHRLQATLNTRWAERGLPAFQLGIGLSTGDVAAALLGSEERLEYTVVGDAVNLAQRLQQWAEPGQTVLSEPTWGALHTPIDNAERLEPALVKGRNNPVGAYRLPADAAAAAATPGGNP